MNYVEQKAVKTTVYKLQQAAAIIVTFITVITIILHAPLADKDCAFI